MGPKRGVATFKDKGVAQDLNWNLGGCTVEVWRCGIVMDGNISIKIYPQYNSEIKTILQIQLKIVANKIKGTVYCLIFKHTFIIRGK